MRHALLDHLADDARRRNLALFVGAGMSLGAGLPSWIGLIEPLATQFGEKIARGGPGLGEQLLHVAGRYEKANGRNALVRYVRSSLDLPGTSPTNAHDVLPRLIPQGAIVTTNYDDLLERAYRAAGVPLHAIVSDTDLAYWDRSVTQLIKLRGDLNQPDTLILTRRDYDTHPLRCPRLYEHLKSILITHTLLFVGYSHNDPDTAMIVHQLQYQLGSHLRHAHSVQFDLEPEAVRNWTDEHQGILLHPVDGGGDRTLALADFLEGLHYQVPKGR